MTTERLKISPPDPSEYAPYYGKYIALVPGQDILSTLEAQSAQTTALLSRLSEEQAEYRYAPGKWSIKEVLGHVSDTERIFAYRALRVARNDRTPIEGFEQDDYVRFGPFGHCELRGLLAEFGLIRQSTLSLFRNLDAEAWKRRGIANKNEISVRAIAYIAAGHELHHVQILKEKYLRPGA